jgi:hypothetical protein
MLQARLHGHRHVVAAAAAILGVFVASSSARHAASEPMASDGAPSGMVAFVAGGVCPPGWVHIYDVEGRVAVGTVATAEVGLTVGLPYADREVRVHHHDYAGTIDLPKKNIAGANGGNESGAAANSYPIMGTTTDAHSGLPFVQMEGCVKP